MHGEDLIWLFIPLLFVVAFLYASVGHGGASGYLALMAIFAFNPDIMRSSALLLNIFVSFIAFYQYYKGGYFKWQLFLPFVITSVPASFIGSWITLDPGIYNKILGGLLIFPILRLAGVVGKENEELTRETPWPAALAIGAIIGFHRFPVRNDRNWRRNHFKPRDPVDALGKYETNRRGFCAFHFCEFNCRFHRYVKQGCNY
jgi:uncharacterized membrane protein YfcA